MLLLAALLMAGTLLAGMPRSSAETPPPGLGGFNPNYLITDSEMFDGDRMSASEIDQFLRNQGANCRTASGGAPCLKDLRMNTPQRTATQYCGAMAPRSNATAGQIIADASRACNINPRVILVMLQKEQGLITTTAPTWRKLDEALGFRCPDFSTCDPAFRGFVHQIYHATSRLQEYGDPARGFRYQVGTHLVQYSPYAFCGEARVQIANRATAALYNYTPFTPTQATLDAGSAAVADDACAAYGNRNFFRNYSQWFIVPNGADAARYPTAAPMGRAPSAPFTDVRYGSMFFTEIAWMKHTGLTTGYPDGTYRPLQPINRDAMAAFLYRAAGSPAYTPPSTSPFRDVPRSSMYYKEIAWAHDQGITTGWPDGTYRPLENINRDAMAAFLYRAAGSPAYTPPSTSPFRDVPRSSMFYKEIAWAHTTDITNGWPDGTYRPVQSINRDAMAAFVYRWKL